MDQVLQEQLDNTYRLQRHIYDATREYFLLGRDGLIERLAPPKHGHVLEIGCGTARNLLLAARCYPAAQFYGIDLSQMMLETASRKLETSSMRERIRMAHGDATSFEAQALFGRMYFERIFFSYSLSMIPRWRDAIHHASRFLALGGEMHIVDFGPGDRLPRLANRALRGWLARFHVAPRDELELALTEMARGAGFEARVESQFGSYTTYAVLKRA
ncbi:MAG: class I SAM-dependent methyltransferase [Proteobacteria bacterium]|nr:class I SAM-dependent methyltransferase [Pseudomonadota bacterium]